jgi:hypothetical protein
VSDAVCLLCGSLKEAVKLPCGECGHTPRDEEMELAHLFSLRHLNADELQAAGARIAAGERPAPQVHQRERRTGPGLERREFLWVALGSVILTPLLGFTCWWGWRTNRPRAARQTLWVSGVVAGSLGLCWVLVML